MEEPYAYTVSPISSSALINITATNETETVVVRNSSDVIVLQGSAETPAELSGSIQLVTGVNTFTIHVTAENGDTETFPLTITNPSSLPCFPAGTRILTAAGYKLVENLISGELVMTADGRQVPAKIYKTNVITNAATAPIRIPKGTFGPASPVQDLTLSPMHAFQIRKGLWMLPMRAAVLSTKVTSVMVGSEITYYHIECPCYLRDNLVVDGTVVESFGFRQQKTDPYTYNARLKGYTRIGPSTKSITKA